MKKGFSLVEILVVLAIVSILLLITFNYLKNERDTKELQTVIDGLVAQIDETRTSSQTGKGGVNHGIKFNSDSYVLFKGSSFDLNDPDNKVFNISEKFELTEDISNSDNVVIFSRISGDVGFESNIDIFKKDNASSTVRIVIGELGDVSVIK